MSKSNLTLETMRTLIRRSRARFASLGTSNVDRAHDRHIIGNEEHFNLAFANKSDELATLESEGHIRRVPGHIYIVLA